MTGNTVVSQGISGSGTARTSVVEPAVDEAGAQALRKDVLNANYSSSNDALNVEELMKFVASPQASNADLIKLSAKIFQNDVSAEVQSAFSSAMQMRSELLSMISNLMKSLHDAAMTVIRNL